MTMGDAVADRIKEPCRQRSITLNKLATISDITQSTLNNIVSGTSKNPIISTVKKICDDLNIGIVEFFDIPIF